MRGTSRTPVTSPLPARGRVKCSPSAEVRDRGLQGLNLSREFRRRGAVARIFVLEGTLAGVEVSDVGPSLPSRADTDENRERDDSAGKHDRRTSGNRYTADDARRAIGDQNCVAPGWFQIRFTRPNIGFRPGTTADPNLHGPYYRVLTRRWGGGRHDEPTTGRNESPADQMTAKIGRKFTGFPRDHQSGSTAGPRRCAAVFYGWSGDQSCRFLRSASFGPAIRHRCISAAAVHARPDRVVAPGRVGWDGVRGHAHPVRLVDEADDLSQRDFSAIDCAPLLASARPACAGGALQAS